MAFFDGMLEFGSEADFWWISVEASYLNCVTKNTLSNEGRDVFRGELPQLLQPVDTGLISIRPPPRLSPPDAALWTR